jgi:hypothetical protein
MMVKGWVLGGWRNAISDVGMMGGGFDVRECKISGLMQTEECTAKVDSTEYRRGQRLDSRGRLRVPWWTRLSTGKYPSSRLGEIRASV